MHALVKACEVFDVSHSMSLVDNTIKTPKLTAAIKALGNGVIQACGKTDCSLP